MNNSQTTNIILMIKPFKFNYNVETASDNAYQNLNIKTASYDIATKAKLEFENFVKKLKKEGINVIQFNDESNLNTPDSLFPNNWISTHGNGKICLYPMFAPNRRLERRQDILDFLKKNFKVNNVIDNFLKFESLNAFLEGTGSMVLDRENKIAYACLSKRTHKSLFQDWCDMMKYKGIYFSASDEGRPIYHTNVLMSVSSEIVFICLDAIPNSEEKELLIQSFKHTNKSILDITKDQMKNFLGNVLELKNNKEESCLVMSSTAFKSLHAEQKKIISKKMKILHSPLDTIEYFGGGSARCMIAEIFLESYKINPQNS